MRKFFTSPLVRISFSLVMLMVAMLLVSDLLGLVPNTTTAELQSRKVIGESLAVQLSTQIANRELHGIDELLRSVVGRNSIILSAAVRGNSRDLLVEFGGHDRHWTLKPGDRSTASQVQVPIFNAQGHWGSVELSFTPLGDKKTPIFGLSSFNSVILFMALTGFIAYLLFLKRTMRELNPDAVIPERVSKALDTLAEGLLIVDQDGYIVFSNLAFARKTGLTPNQLLGKQSSKLNWEVDDEELEHEQLPWSCVLEGKALATGTKIRLNTVLKETYTFNINASPITGTADKIRGVLITFDDITDIEIKNEELRRTLLQLNQSQHEITRQNRELQLLATRDPLTDSLNRRSLFQGLDTLFAEAGEEHETLSCIMLDIDHFKSVNDRFGHAVGDKVIKFLAKTLSDLSRPNDLVGRYGGEEFCIVLPGADIEEAASIAERMRLAVQDGHGARFTGELRITSSFGVSNLADGAASPNELVDQADKALYVAKETGRNRVIKWSGTRAGDASEDTSDPPVSELALACADQQSDGGIEGEETELLLLPSVEGPPHSLDEKPASCPIQAMNLDQSNRDEESAQARKPDQQEPNSHPNRVLLFDRLDQGMKRAQRHATQIALLVMDADASRRVNDTLGLAAGEKFTQIVVTRLKQTLRLTDTVALTEDNELLFTVSRLGGNELVVLLTDLKQTEIITAILQRIFSALDEPVEVDGAEFYLNTTIGVSVYPHDGEDPETLLRNASGALREAKQKLGRNNYRFYADEINQQSKQQIRMEAELHRALERGELVLYYQPKLDLQTGNILGMEALLRWQHPQLGTVSPNDFIPLAEQTGLIDKISQWVIRSACRQIRAWREAGHSEVTVAVNLSPVEFRNPDLGTQIIALVDRVGIPANALELEITETSVMQNMDKAVSILETLSDAGMSISIDDFGTGYSSLTYLKRFPLSKVKIDRSFISDFMQASNDAAIVSAIIAMSHSLGLRVVAEGVETEEQLHFLQDLHCDEVQGYLISKPVPRAEASELLHQPSSVQWTLKEHPFNNRRLGADQGVSVAASMIGVLNEYPEMVVDYRTGRDSRAGIR